MAENLRKEVEGATAYVSKLSPDASSNANTYGLLYTWQAAAGGTNTPENVDGYVRGICPQGWHLPTTKEINVLRIHNWSQLASDSLWVNVAGTNASGFNALPAGFYNGAAQRYEGLHVTTWFHGDSAETAFGLQYHCCEVPNNISSLQSSYSVRCVKDCE